MIRNLILLSILLLSTLIHSQNNLNGIVVDEHSLEKLFGVNIILLDSDNGTSTDITGNLN